MKKLSKLLVLISVLILGISVNVFAKEDLYLVVDGKKVETDAACFIEKDRTLVPIRFISEALGDILIAFGLYFALMIIVRKRGA